MEVGREPWLNVARMIWLRDDGTYDLLYQAYWGARSRNAPGFGAIDVRESGEFSVAGGTLSLEPEVTRAVEVRGGNRERRTLNNEQRAYLARIDGGYLNLAGRCARYQIEPICRESREIWISLRSTSIGALDDVPEP